MPPQREVPPDVRAALVRSYADGARIRSLGDPFGFDYKTVRRVLVEEGVAIRGRGRQPGQRSHATPSLIGHEAAIARAYEDGASRLSLAKAYGTYPARIQALLTEAGVSLRDDRTRRGQASHMFRGGRQKGKDGYIRVLVPDDSPFASMRHGKARTVLEHRLVMAEDLGRPLFPYEVVHHINGVKDDNRRENLELWEQSHPPGQRNGEHTSPHCPTCTCHGGAHSL